MLATVHGKLLKNSRKMLMKLKSHKFRNWVWVSKGNYFPLEAPSEVWSLKHCFNSILKCSLYLAIGPYQTKVPLQLSTFNYLPCISCIQFTDNGWFEWQLWSSLNNKGESWYIQESWPWMKEVFIANYSGLLIHQWVVGCCAGVKDLWSMAIDSTSICIVHNPGMAHHLLKGQPLWWIFYQELHSTYTGYTQLSV